MSWRWGERDGGRQFLSNNKNCHPLPPAARFGPEAPSRGLFGANEGLSPSGAFVFIAEAAVNQRIPKKPTPTPPPSFRVCFCHHAAVVVMGFSQLKKAQSLFHSPAPSFRKRHLWMIPHDSNLRRTWGLGIVFTLIFTCEYPRLLARQAFKERHEERDNKEISALVFFRHKQVY